MLTLFKNILKPNSPFKSHPHRCIIDITTACDLNCVDCNRSCGYNQASSNEYISLDRIQQFISESIDQKRLWYGLAKPKRPFQNRVWVRHGDPAAEGIRIEGGEPTLHPQFFAILELLLEYKKKHEPLTNIIVCSNGHSEKTRRILEKIPAEIKIVNSGKQSKAGQSHCAFNMAPIDDEAYQDHDFFCGCWLPLYYGFGLTKDGYYPHPICGNIDRVFGFNIGLKEMPPMGYSWEQHYKKLCPYCGHYSKYPPPSALRPRKIVDKDRGRMSASWQKAYAEYKRRTEES